MRMNGRKVLLTGGAGGLGSATAGVLADAGARVLILDLPDSTGGALSSRTDAQAAGSARFVPGDLSRPDQVHDMVAELAEEEGGIDVLVNNAAIYPSKLFDEYTLDEYREVLRVNAEAAYVLARAVVPGMRAAGWGRIVNISSITFYGGWADLAPYVVSKGALVGLTRALARELGPSGITVNAVAPGAFPTAAEEIHPDPEGYEAFVLEHQAIKRRGAPEDVGRAVLFFASDASAFITGQTLNVDGGWVMT